MDVGRKMEDTQCEKGNPEKKRKKLTTGNNKFHLSSSPLTSQKKGHYVFEIMHVTRKIRLKTIRKTRYCATHGKKYHLISDEKR